MEVLAVRGEPVVCRIASRFGVSSHGRPHLVVKRVDQFSGRRSHTGDDRERRLQRAFMVVKGDSPMLLVVTDDHGRRFSGEQADPDRGVCFGISAVNDDLMDRPIVGCWSPFPGPLGNLIEGRLEHSWAFRIAIDLGLPFQICHHGTPRFDRNQRRRTPRRSYHAPIFGGPRRQVAMMHHRAPM